MNKWDAGWVGVDEKLGKWKNKCGEVESQEKIKMEQSA